MSAQDTHHAHIDALIDDIERRFALPAGSVRGRSRSPRDADARHAAFWALSHVGLRPCDIARLFGLNHSTVVHGLARAARHTEWQQLVGPAIELAGAGGIRAALHRWLERTLRALDAGDRRAVTAYVVCTLLGWERRPGHVCGYGLMLIASRPQIRAAVAEALASCDLELQTPRLELQAARAWRAG